MKNSYLQRQAYKNLTRRSFLASSLRAALFGAYAINSTAIAQSTPWRNWSGGLSCQPQGRYDISGEDQLVELLKMRIQYL